eukprot:scaffold659700_cov71-Prasinocladus_malaysianus.AAC.1
MEAQAIKGLHACGLLATNGWVFCGIMDNLRGPALFFELTSTPLCSRFEAMRGVVDALGSEIHSGE